ncbi:hypothetical protein N0V93_002438 [Gnomoniopsis smithogilvyi]|uniref:Uncharacterized protein n=1 Tax=Gnomoniopsis smithogilvyi TaxID=1191159 RepID=A0A9W8YYT3_9PEZI|nr:hypothetical protein N0V93_002438 [Gnomoniopsis smithogilvyi]
MSAETVVAKPSTSPVVEDDPTTPQDNAAPDTVASASDSQQSLPSTEPPASPPANPAESFKSERSDDHAASAASAIIPSSLTPPPSSQVPSNNDASRAAASAQRQRMLSPPVTVLNPVRPDATPAGLYTAPRPEQVVAASPDELRAMLQTCIAEQTRLKMEAAHHKLQYQLLSVRAEEDAHRAAVEQELTLRQLDALRRQNSEASAPPRRIPSAEPEITQSMYDQLRDLSERALKDNEKLRKDHDEVNKRLKAAKKLIVRQEEQTDDLREENDLLRNRLLDKRELWEKLASPGGMFHTPKTTNASPAQYRQTPRQTPKHKIDRQAQPFDVLLQAATQENSSAPSTPVTPNRAPGGRHPLKHSRGVQSLSSLPSTPHNSRPRGSDLLPPPDLVPHTEPTRRFVNRSFVPDTPDRGGLTFAHEVREERGRHSRESTISADDNQVLARAALQSVAQAARSFATHASSPPRARIPLPSHRSRDTDSQIYESQASQEASAMLRRDPRESFEVASSHNSRDVTPTPVSAEKRLQSTLRGPVNKLGLSNKRKFDPAEYREEARKEPISPTKRLRLEGGLREGNPIIGLGIRD